MDMRIEAAPMEASAEMQEVNLAVKRIATSDAIVGVALVASFSCPSVSGHSLSAVAPDHDFERRLAKAGA